jgi:hypothetical protein
MNDKKYLIPILIFTALNSLAVCVLALTIGLCTGRNEDLIRENENLQQELKAQREINFRDTQRFKIKGWARTEILPFRMLPQGVAVEWDENRKFWVVGDTIICINGSDDTMTGLREIEYEILPEPKE